jgi:hypothetical protein
MSDAMGLRLDDWYAYLRLSPGATTDEIESAVERLSRQATALATTAPERSQSLRETIRAIKRDLLSGPENRQQYDDRVWQSASPGRDPAPPPPALPPASFAVSGITRAGQGTGSRLARFLRTGWTCPSCGRGAVPSDKFCTRCGTPIRPVHPEPGPGQDGTPRPRPTCQSCANLLGPLDVFCSKCGTRRQLG